MRCAIYFTPPPEDPLYAAAVRWLGRDAFTGERIEGAEVQGIIESDRAFLTAPVRRFGFHATMMAPFSISASQTPQALDQALKRFAARTEAVEIPAMRIALIEDCFALVPAAPAPALSALASEIVTGFDRFRAPVGEFDFASPVRAQLTERQVSQLMRWGHPFVFEDFRFHLALTGPVPSLERQHVAQVLDLYFGSLARGPLSVNQLAIFTEPEPYAPLRVHCVHPLAQKEDRKSA